MKLLLDKLEDKKETIWQMESAVSNAMASKNIDDALHILQTIVSKCSQYIVPLLDLVNALDDEGYTPPNTLKQEINWFIVARTESACRATSIEKLRSSYHVKGQGHQPKSHSKPHSKPDSANQLD